MQINYETENELFFLFFIILVVFLFNIYLERLTHNESIVATNVSH